MTLCSPNHAYMYKHTYTLGGRNAPRLAGSEQPSLAPDVTFLQLLCLPSQLHATCQSAVLTQTAPDVCCSTGLVAS